MYNLPDKIKRHFFIHNLVSAIFGFVITIAVLYVQFFVLEKLTVDPAVSIIFSFMLWVIAGFAFLFMFIPSVFSLIFKNYHKRIERKMKKYNITTECLERDYDSAEKVGGVRLGAVCTYAKQRGRLLVIPKSTVLMVYQKVYGHKQKKVGRTLDGVVLDEKSTINEHYTYTVILRDIDSRSYRIRCNGPRMANTIIQHYASSGSFIIGNSPASQKEYRRRRKAMKELEQNGGIN